VNGKAPIPRSLELAISCKEWGTLPEAGGYMDQPVRLMNEMETAWRAYNNMMDFRTMQKKGGDAWQKWQAEHYGIIKAIAEITKDINNG
jgi:hypothetical protein